MHCLLKNALNFDKFKNIKIDLINKVKASDTTDSHEENEVFNLLKDKEFFSEGLQLSRHNNLECTSSVKKKLKHINNLKRHLNDITNLRQLEKCRLYKETGRVKTIRRRTVGVSSFLKNYHGDGYDDKSLEMFNRNVPHYGEIKRVYKDVFCKTVSRRIQKKGLIRKTFFKTFMFKFISELNSNNDRKHIDITKFELTNGKLIAYLHCYKKCSPEKVHHVRNVQIYLKKKIYYKSIITKKLVSSVKRNKQMRTCLRETSERHCDDRNQVKSGSNELHNAPEKIYTNREKDRKNEFNNCCADNCEESSFLVKPFETKQLPNKNATNSVMAKWNCLQSSADKKEFHKNTGRNAYTEFVSTCGATSTGETVKTLIEGGYRKNLKIQTFSNLGNGEMKDLKKTKEVFQIHNSENVHKNSSSQKNINLSELRRVSSNDRQNNKKEFKRIRDPRLHFLSNNVNFYATVINEEKCKAENTKKGDNLSDQNIMQNGEMNEIKQKIKTALISLNNIRKNNYKLKFCLEKEIIDNTIHQNELKRSLGSVFSENSAHKKSMHVGRNSPEGGSKHMDKRRNSRHDGDKHHRQKAKTQREENAQNGFCNYVRSIDEKVTLEEKGGSGCNSVSCEKIKNERLHSTEEGIKSRHAVIKSDQNKGKTKLVSKTEAKRNHFNESRGTELVQKCHTNEKKEQNLPKRDIKLSNRTFTLNGEVPNRHTCNGKSLKDEEKRGTLNNTPKVHSWEVAVKAQKDGLKNNEKEKIRGIDERARSSFLGDLKSKVEKVEAKEMDRKNEYNKVGSKHKNLSGVNKSINQFKENNSYANRNKYKETIKNIEENNLNSPLDDDKKKHNIVANSRDCTKKFTASQEIVCDEANRERKQFDLSNVRNIKKIITCGIYVNKEMDRINKRNKIAISIIENYLESTNRTCSFFSKQKEKKAYLQKNCIPGREYNKKEAKVFPGLYDHYAFLLHNVKNYKVV